MKIDWAHEAMMSRRVVLGEVVSKVITARCPKNVELSLLGAVPDPIETHVHGAGALLFNGAVEYAIGRGVVYTDWCGRLRVSHFVECGAAGG